MAYIRNKNTTSILLNPIFDRSNGLSERLDAVDGTSISQRRDEVALLYIGPAVINAAFSVRKCPNAIAMPPWI
jgi:hypothetical protein